MKKSLYLVAGLFFVCSLFILANSALSYNSTVPAYTSSISFDEAKTQDKPMLLVFYTPWCTACKNLEPAIKNVKSQFGLKYNIVSINCDSFKNVNLVRAFAVSFFPTIHIYEPKKQTTTFIEPQYYNENALTIKLNDYLTNRK